MFDAIYGDPSGALRIPTALRAFFVFLLFLRDIPT